MVLCSVLGCGRKKDRLGLCTRHYMRNRRNGSPTDGRSPPGSHIEFIMNAIRQDCNECIIWPFSVNAATGYGQTKIDGVTTTPHRAALIIKSGLNPGRGVHAAHAPEICHNRMCINPNHLRWATPLENERDKEKDGTKLTGINVHNAILTADQVLRIRSDTRKNKPLATEMGVGVNIVENVRYGKTYKDVT